MSACIQHFCSQQCFVASVINVISLNKEQQSISYWFTQLFVYIFNSQVVYVITICLPCILVLQVINYVLWKQLQHITRKILLLLNSKSLLIFKEMSHVCKKIYKKPLFLMQKWTLQGLSRSHYKEWMTAIQMTKNTRLESHVQSYIEKVIEIGHIVDILCYIDKKTLGTFTTLKVLSGKRILE